MLLDIRDRAHAAAVARTVERSLFGQGVETDPVQALLDQACRGARPGGPRACPRRRPSGTRTRRTYSRRRRGLGAERVLCPDRTPTERQVSRLNQLLANLAA